MQVPTSTTVQRRQRSQAGQRISRFVFTLNNYTDEEVEQIKTLTPKFLIFGKETGESNTPHLQGACVLGTQMSFSTIKKLAGLSRAHIETMRGTPEQSVAYCTKEDDDPYIFGTLPAPGKRNDLHHCVELMEGGASIRDICNGNDTGAKACMVKYSRGLIFLHNMKMVPKRQPPKVIWIHGSTGIGKTRAAEEYASAICEDYWMSSGELRWFDGYMGQPAVIFDDYRTSFTKFATLLRLLDRYKMMVEIKGGYQHWIPTHILITAPKSPSYMWNLRTEEDIAQLERRITHTIEGTTYEEITKALQEITPYEVEEQEKEQEKEKEKDMEEEEEEPIVPDYEFTRRFMDRQEQKRMLVGK